MSDLLVVGDKEKIVIPGGRPVQRTIVQANIREKCRPNQGSAMVCSACGRGGGTLHKIDDGKYRHKSCREARMQINRVRRRL